MHATLAGVLAAFFIVALLIYVRYRYRRSTDEPTPSAPAFARSVHYRIDDELAEIRERREAYCKRARALAALDGAPDPKECSLDESGRPPQEDIPDDLKPDGELPVDLKGALIAVCWTLGLAEKEAVLDNVRHRVRVSRETLENVIDAYDERCN